RPTPRPRAGLRILRSAAGRSAQGATIGGCRGSWRVDELERQAKGARMQVGRRDGRIKLDRPPPEGPGPTVLAELEPDCVPRGTRRHPKPPGALLAPWNVILESQVQAGLVRRPGPGSAG